MSEMFPVSIPAGAPDILVQVFGVSFSTSGKCWKSTLQYATAAALPVIPITAHINTTLFY